MMVFENKGISRRKFIQTSLIGPGVLATSGFGYPRETRAISRDIEEPKLTC